MNKTRPATALPAPRHSPPRTATRDLPVYSSHSLFGGTDAVIIEHGGAQYLLRRTRQGKLLLTK